MAKITLDNIASGYASTTKINNNNDTIEAELNNKVLYRNNPSGEPNQMENELDMNSNKIINLPDGISNQEPVTVQQLNGAIAAAGSGLIASQAEVQLGSQAVSRVFTFTGITYTIAGNNLYVFRNGQKLEKGVDYNETSSSSVTLLFDPNDNDRFNFITNIATTNSTTDTSAITHTQSGTDYNLATYLQNRHEIYAADYSDLIVDGNWSPAVQAAVNASNGADVILPAGSIRLDTTITYDTSGLGDTSAPKIKGRGIFNTAIDNQTGGAAFHVTSGTAAEFAYGFTVEDLRITCLTVSAGTIGIQSDGCRFVTLERVVIDNQSSHGLYGLSSIGDFTDTSQMILRHVQIESCGGYGVYGKCTGGAIQYNWNADQCRIGLNTLGGVLLESATNIDFRNTGIYYNSGFGFKCVTPSGGSTPKLVDVWKCEFDTNDGVQIDIEDGNSVNIYEPYLIANPPAGTTFTKGIVIGADVNDFVITCAYPRLNPALTGLTVMEFTAGCSGVVRDTSYQGYSVLNGDMYVNNSTEVAIDDTANRNAFYKGTFTVQVKNSSLTVTSPTTVTGYYRINGDVTTVAFRELNNIDTSGFAGGDIVVIQLPYTALTGATSGYIGNCIITSDTGTGIPFPTVGSGSNTAAFQRSGSNAFLTASELTSGVSDISSYTLTYIKDA